MDPDGTSTQTPGQAAAEPYLLKRIKANFKRASQHSSKWRGKAREDYDFVAGTQWTQDDLHKLREEMRPIITFNRIGPVIDAVAGHEINNRQEVRYLPRELGDAKVNEMLTAAGAYSRDLCDAEDEESDAFMDTVICGMGWTETRPDTDENPDGEIVEDRVDPLEMWWDPSAKKRNVVDRRWQFRVKDWELDDVKRQWPEHWEAIVAMRGQSLTDREFAHQPHDATYAPWYATDDAKHRAVKEDKLEILEYQEKVYVDSYRVLNPMSGQIEEVDQETFDRLRPRLKQMGAQWVRDTKRRVMRAFVAGDVVLSYGPGPCETDFNYQCITGKRDRNQNTFYGLVRGMKDPQRWANKWMSQYLHILNSNAKGGIMAEEGVFADPRRAEEEWARPNGITEMAPGALAQGKVQPKPMADIPVGFDRLMTMSIGAVHDVSGISPELMGTTDRTQPGVVEENRKAAGLTILGTIFGNLRRFRKRQGRVQLYMIQEYISDGRLIRIVGETMGQGMGQYIQLIRQPDTIRYDVIVDDQPTSPNMKERVFGILMQMMPMLLQAGVPIPPIILDYTPLPASLIEKWKEQLQPPAPDPMAERLKQLSMAAQEAQVAKTQTEAAENMSQVQLNRARAAEAGAKVQTDAARAQADVLGKVVPLVRPPDTQSGFTGRG